ncbi:ABC transporter substrate-binding protein [Ruminococcaceae bacterium OttesenSCG-928-D13]|nr:ABC transporter substrate-binding protein [Ruminococcaceae bacterium OttesenSCG-928-D13]
MKISKTKRFLALALTLLMAFALAACDQGGDSSSTPSNDGDSSVASSQQGGNVTEGEDFQETTGEKPAGIQPGTTFTYSISYDVPTYMPYMDTRNNFLALQLYDNLLYKYHANLEDIRGNLAESWEVSEDGLEWVFQIKQDAYFSNGNQVNAEAFVKTWDVAKEYQPRYFVPVESYVATGEFELTITLSTPSPTFIYDLPMQPTVGVVDPAGLEEYGPEDNRAAVGAGPYYIESYVSGEGFVLKANENYHNPDKFPSIETVNLSIIPDENTAVIALMNGEIDSMVTVNIEIYNNLVDNGWNVAVVEDRVNPFWFNAREVELFRDDVVREALCHMIDWQAATDLVYDGLFPAPNSYWVGPGSSPYGDNYSYDPELGIQMLEEAGYSKDDIAFTFLADPDFTNIELALQAQFQELGFNNIQVETYDAATCYGMLKGGTYEVFPVHNGYGVESPLMPYSMGLTPESTQRVMWLDYIDEARYEEAMTLYQEAATSPTFEAYLEKVEQLTKLCQEENVALGGLQTMRVFGVAPRFGGVYIAPIVGYFDFCYLWDTEAAA